MRSFSTALNTILNSNSIKPFFLVKLTTPDIQLLNTTFSSDLTVGGIGTFVANGNLLTVEPPKLSDNVDREAYKIVYADSDRTMQSLFRANLAGSKVTVFVGFINTTSGNLGLTSATPDSPMLGYSTNVTSSDLIIAYEGVVDTQGYTVDPGNGTILAVIECASPVVSLGLIKSFMTTGEALKRLDSTDIAFDKVYEGATKINLQWGKA